MSKKKKDRKTKGNFSTFDEFISDSGSGEILADAQLSESEILAINVKTKLADLPISPLASEATDEHKESDPENGSTIGLPLDYQRSTIGLPIANKDATNTSNITKNGSTIGLPLDYQRSTIGTTIGLPPSVPSEGSTTNANGSTIGLPLDYHLKKTPCRWNRKYDREYSYLELVGLEKKLVDYVFSICNQIGQLVTPHISGITLRDYLSIKKKSTFFTVVSRVEQKRFLSRIESKSARGGFMVFQMPPNIYQQILISKNGTTIGLPLVDNNQETGPAKQSLAYQRSTQGTTIGTTTDSRKEGSLYNNNYLTSQPVQNPTDVDQPEMFDVKIINHENTRSLMPDYNYWPKYLNDLKRNLLARKLTLSTVDLQNLIDRLPEYISFSSNSGQPVKHVGGFFIKEAMNFAEGAECTLTLFKTKAEIQRQDALTRLKQKAIEEQKQMAMDIDQIKLGLFAEWRNSFTVEEQKTMTHPMNSTDILIRSAMRAKFETEVWPTKKIELGLD